MYGARYAWLIPGWFNKKWWKIRLKNESVACTEDEMNKAVKGYIACDNLKISPDNTVTVSGQVAKSLYNIPTDKRGVRLFRVTFCLCSKTSPRGNCSEEIEFDWRKNETVGRTYFIWIVPMEARFHHPKSMGSAGIVYCANLARLFPRYLVPVFSKQVLEQP